MLRIEDLEDLFKKWAQEATLPEKDDELLTSHGLAEYIGYSYDWVMRASSRVNQGKEVDFPPIHRRGRKLLFRKSDVDKWLDGKEGKR